MMSNQQIIAGQTADVEMAFGGKANGKPGTFWAGSSDGEVGSAEPNADGWAVSGVCPAENEVPMMAKVTAGGAAAQGVVVYLNASDRAVFWQAPVDVVAAPAAVPVIPAPVNLRAATTEPVQATPAPEPTEPPVQAMQPLVVTISHDTPTVLSRLAADLGEGTACWPNVPLVVDNPGVPTLLTTARSEVPLPIPGFVQGYGAMELTARDGNGKYWRRIDVLQLTEGGYSN